MALTTNIETRFAWRHTKVTSELSTTKDQARRRYLQQFTNGTGNNQVDELWHDRRYVTASTTTDDLDLVGGVTNMFGDTVSFSTIKGILLINLGVPAAYLELATTTFTPTEGEDLLVGGVGNLAWSQPFNNVNASVIVVPSGGQWLLTAPLSGFALVAGSSDVLRIAHNGTDDIAYDIVIQGVKV